MRNDFEQMLNGIVLQFDTDEKLVVSLSGIQTTEPGNIEEGME